MSTTDINKSENVKTIHAINRETVHKICSGQVVLSLAIAVKELLENALDAGATNIEIRLKEYGSELIEVSDNGSGVEEHNFATLTQKHFTSKIKEFSDLENIATLGFRGEALSSLCALANLSVLTRDKSTEFGTKIEYDANGDIKSKIPCARQIGTTVSLSNLFYSLPVRYKELTKNLKREFHKMCQLLYAYCLISEGVRILCTNQTKKGAKTTVISTQGSKVIKENIIYVFGIKQLESLIEIQLFRPNENALEEYGLENLKEEIPFTFSGYISKCSHGSGRSSCDRQFFYINSRPCEPTKIMKLVNTVYKYFNVNQYPFVVLNIKTAQSQIDINVTPDKRKIFLQQENLLLATLKTSLLEMFKEFPSTLKVQNLNISNANLSQNQNKSVDNLKDWCKSKDTTLQETNRNRKRCVENEKPKGIMGFIFNKRLKIDNDATIQLSENSASEDEEEQIKKFIEESVDSSDSDIDSNVNTIILEKKLHAKKLSDMISKDIPEKTFIGNNTSMNVADYKLILENPKENLLKIENRKLEECDKNTKFEKTIEIPKETPKNTNETIINENEDTLILLDVDTKSSKHSSIETLNYSQSNKTFKIDLSVSRIQSIIKKMNFKSGNEESLDIKFRSEITNKNAEVELERHISKDMFEKMEIIGQFNKGFIITKLNSDIFIIDQHASDEKYNFETLQQTTVIRNQKLVNPKPLDLTAANELLLIDNIEKFEKNGFAFHIDEKAEPRHKIFLTAIPVSKNFKFGKDAIDELLFMLQEDSSIQNYRPSGIRAMFASRACRKSVMIGDVLSKNDMRKLVDHMGKIDQPWNCPHGRPTMRHLVNLDLLRFPNDTDEDDE